MQFQCQIIEFEREQIIPIFFTRAITMNPRKRPFSDTHHRLQKKVKAVGLSPYVVVLRSPLYFL